MNEADATGIGKVQKRLIEGLQERNEKMRGALFHYRNVRRLVMDMNLVDSTLHEDRTLIGEEDAAALLKLADNMHKMANEAHAFVHFAREMGAAHAHVETERDRLLQDTEDI